MYGFSRDYKEHKIFNYLIYGIVITIVAAVVAVVIWFAYVVVNLGSILPGLNPQNPPTQSDILSLLTPYMAPFIAIFGFVGLINIVFTVRALNLLSIKTEVPMFKTGAKVLLAGGLLTVVLGIAFAAFASASLVSFEGIAVLVIPGGIVQYLGWALLAKAFFTVKAPPPNQYMPPAYPQMTQQVKYCPNCGAQNLPDALYCARCGQKLP
jgi:uncharacterized paraquat-inducible protein A